MAKDTCRGGSGGAALDLWGPHGLPLAVELALVAFLLFAFLRRTGGERA